MAQKTSKYLSLNYYYILLRRDRHQSGRIAFFLGKAVAILVVSADRFVKNVGTVSASALTFYTVLSLIPVLALLLAVAKGFGVSRILEDLFREQSFANPEMTGFFLNFANRALENTRGGLITGIGIVMLLWMVIKVLSNTEDAMNRIWGIRQGRGLAKKFADYLSILFIAPLLIALVSGMNVFLSTNLQEIAREEGILRYAGSAVIFLVKLSPYVLLWLLFTFLYIFMPAAPVRFRHAVVAGIVAGSACQIVQWFYLRFQIGVSSYNAIYGSLAALPLLLVWLQLSWSIVLWGAEISYILRNRHIIFRSETEKENRWLDNIELAVRIMRIIASEYTAGRGALSLGALCKELKMNSQKIRVVLDELVGKKILAELKNGDEPAYLPEVDLHKLSLADLFLQMSDIEKHQKEAWEEKFVRLITKEFGHETFA
ncbi:MAG: YihY/virulence factor BrkB family protein [Culturomica sp.]|jgi:membrane protein|nr:YihY/virulence factor BrkB family protein [Culturomica sp.]